jgi:hypothetical protein
MTKMPTHLSISIYRLPFTKNLGRDGFFSIMEWQGEILFHFRIYEEIATEGKEVKWIPTKKGIMLNKYQITNILITLEIIHAALEKTPGKENKYIFPSTWLLPDDTSR